MDICWLESPPCNRSKRIECEHFGPFSNDIFAVIFDFNEQNVFLVHPISISVSMQWLYGCSCFKWHGFFCVSDSAIQLLCMFTLLLFTAYENLISADFQAILISHTLHSTPLVLVVYSLHGTINYGLYVIFLHSLHHRLRAMKK